MIDGKYDGKLISLMLVFHSGPVVKYDLNISNLQNVCRKKVYKYITWPWNENQFASFAKML